MKRTANGTTGLLSSVEMSFIEATRGAITQPANNTIKMSDAMAKRGVVDRDDSRFMARPYHRDLNGLTANCRAGAGQRGALRAIWASGANRCRSAPCWRNSALAYSPRLHRSCSHRRRRLVRRLLDRRGRQHMRFSASSNGVEQLERMRTGDAASSGRRCRSGCPRRGRCVRRGSRHMARPAAFRHAPRRVRHRRLDGAPRCQRVRSQ